MFEDVRPGDRVRITIETVFVMASQGCVHLQGQPSFPKEIVKSVSVIRRTLKIDDRVGVKDYPGAYVVIGIHEDLVWLKRGEAVGTYPLEEVYHVD
jgi:hypothetical protein